jgi:hypothetical protein
MYAMSTQGQPPRKKRTTKRERAAALVHKYIQELAPQLLQDTTEELKTIHQRLIEEMKPDGPYESSLVREIAQSMLNMNVVRDAEQVIWSLQGKIEFGPFMEMLEHLQTNSERSSRAFDRALRHLLEGQRLRRKSAHLVSALNAQEAAKRIRPANSLGEMQVNKSSNSFRWRTAANPKPEIRDEDLAGAVDPATGKKTPWIN